MRHSGLVHEKALFSTAGRDKTGDEAAMYLIGQLLLPSGLCEVGYTQYERAHHLVVPCALQALIELGHHSADPALRDHEVSGQERHRWPAGHSDCSSRDADA